MPSPYLNFAYSEWTAITNQILADYPLQMNELAKIVLQAWDDIFETRVGTLGYLIGKDILPQPQIMGFLLHEIIPLNLESKYPQKWRRGLASTEFDAHCIFDTNYSFEIKTSSSDSNIFGNRSYTHVSELPLKRRGGFMLTVNFEKFATSTPLLDKIKRPDVRLIRFGWLDAEDWIGQAAQSGQQARLKKEAKAYKLKIIWETLKTLKER